MASKNVPTQTKPLQKDVSVQTPGCKECLRLSLEPGDNAKDARMWCKQVNELLWLVAKPKEKVEGLRSIRES